VAKPRKVVYDPNWHKCRKPLLWPSWIQPMGLIWTCKCGKTWRKEPDHWEGGAWSTYYGK
jgi:hypothetical protein